ncbi:MAG: hypothetical protein L3K23_05470 [Thermoplasmata archaeon]|nr:hypothetical protein [Thermoplasmata archaeon]
MAVRRTAVVGESELLASYPFLPGAERLVAAFAPSLKDLIEDPALSRARELGRARIRAAVEDPTGGTGVGELVLATHEEQFLSFLYARLLLSAPRSGAAIRRWAVAEAKRGSTRLNGADLEVIREVARRLGFGFDVDGHDVELVVPEYLKLATPIREADFRLVHQAVAHGRVRIDRERAARLLQEAVRLRLGEPIALGDDVRTRLLDAEAEFLEEVLRRVPTPTSRAGGVGPLLPEKFPPCIRKMRRVLEAGENLSHSGRFALAAFLHRAGADAETIVDAYRGAPDFDEGITRYQVEHITHRDDGRGYSPPECATLRSHGLCVREGDPGATSPADRARDPLCYEEYLRHPLQYYRIRGGRPVDDSPPDGTSGGRRSGAGGRPA